MDQFCGSTFWDTDLTWNSEQPDFTECFQKTVLVWLPCAFLWAFCPIEIYCMLKRKKKRLTWSWLFTLKLGLTTALLVLSICDFGKGMYDGSHDTLYAVEYTTPLVKILTFALVIIILVYNRKCGLYRSGVLFIFWLIFVVCEIPRLRSALRDLSVLTEHAYYAVSFVIYYALMCVLFLFNFFADPETVIGKQTEVEKPLPLPKSSFPAKICFTWFDSLAWRGFRNRLSPEDLWRMNSDDTSAEIFASFDKHWQKAVRRNQGDNGNKMANFGKQKADGKEKRITSLLPMLIKVFGPDMFVGACYKFGEDVLTFASPLIMKVLISFMSSDELQWKGYFYAVLFLLVKTIRTFFSSQHFSTMLLTGLRMRTLLTAAIYRKALRMSNTTRKESTVGEIVNLMSVDAQSFMDLLSYFHLFWSSPFQIAVCLYLLWNTLGFSAFAGLGAIVIFVPGHTYMTRKLLQYKELQMKKKDERVKLTNEVLNGIKVLKLYAWEGSFERHIGKIRNEEMAILKIAEFLTSGLYFVWSCTPPLVCLVSLMTFALSDASHVLDAGTVFVSLTLFNIMQVPIVAFPELIALLVQARVSLARISRFMSSEELDPSNVKHDQSQVDPLVIENGNFSWTSDESSTPVLRNINLRVKQGDLVAVVGTVGSGKSSLLSALLGEMDLSSGRVNSKGTIAYVSQQAWIQNATVRNNILFGSEFEETFYRKVIDVCALGPDLEMLAAGDRTEIGEKGINLSGGQKQRISLARAVYNDADIYLFDDPLSAVDAHVGKHIFDKVMGPQGLLRNKTRVVVTHGICYLPQVDYIFVLKNGEVSECGTYNELLDVKGAFAEFLLQNIQQVDFDIVNEAEDLGKIKQHLKSAIGTEEVQIKLSEMKSPTTKVHATTTSCVDNESPNQLVQRQGSVRRYSSGELDGNCSTESGPPEYTVGEKCIEVEKSKIGKVAWDVYYHYVRAAGWFLLVSTVLAKALGEVSGISSNMSLSFWTDDKEAVVNGVADPAKRDMYLSYYGSFAIGRALLVFLSLLAMTIGCVRSSRILHDKLLYNILRVPVGFFDVTPLGRILNRFGKDMDVVDDFLPRIIKLWLFAVSSALSCIVIICYTTPIFVAVIIPIAVVYHLLQQFYISTMRQLKRLESVSRSPIYSHYSESINGASVIRAYRAPDRFIEELDDKVDMNHVCSYPSIIADWWLGVRLESIGNLIVFFAVLFAVLQKDVLSVSLAALSVTYSLQITDYLNWLVKSASDVEANIVSVERVKEYSEKSLEAPWEIPDHIPPEEWPSQGRVEFRDYKLRYREGLDLVLHDLTFTVAGGEKVGIVGRTGAGKSSLTLALFRIIEAAGGRIFVDGLDISTIGLHSLRSKLTIIPQDPVLFSGSLRLNLDPCEKYDDEEIWRALEHAHLKNFVQELRDGLMYEITEGGENLSVGQRQLICLARALLRKTKLLVLDEATASVDMETDDFVQRTIREEFQDCTVLTIAHRLNTILDSDKVLVLDKGCMVEFDSPENLLQNKTGIFYSMARDAGLVE